MINQIDRIRKMEIILDECTTVIENIATAVEEGKITDDIIKKFNLIQDNITILANYYESEEWKEDYLADEENQLPPCLKRGVLSEDAVYDLLTDNDILKEQLELFAK